MGTRVLLHQAVSVYDAWLRPLLFRLDAETAHELGVWALSQLSDAPKLARWLRQRTHPRRAALASTVAGIDFPNPVGLAAGLDKNAEAILGLFAVGFGFVEVGTVTPQPQPGNEAPRLFRLPEHDAIINRMGFNNAGAHAMASRLRDLPSHPGPIGVNLGKNKDTPLDRAADDYVTGARLLAPFADYLVINLSSPNTPGLRQLQAPEALHSLLQSVRAATSRPLFLKIAPDLGDEAVDAVVDVAVGAQLDGLICTNTTITRPLEHPLAQQAGGLSGRPVMQRSTEVIRRAFVRARMQRARLPIIGVGGIFNAADAWAKVCAGASLVQVYTGFIYQGPPMVRQMLDGLEKLLKTHGFSNISQAIGRDC